MSLAQGYLVDTDDLGLRWRMPSQLRSHVLYLEGFDRIPVEPQFFGHVLYGRAPAASADIIGEPLGVKRVVGQEGQLFLFHGITKPAEDASNLQSEINPDIAAGLVPDASDLVVVPAPLNPTAASAGCFFPSDEENNPSPQVSENPLDLGQRAESGESIFVEKQTHPSWNRHALIISFS